MPLILRPPTDELRPLTERLEEIGRSRRRARLASGGFGLIAVAAAGFTAALGADLIFNLPPVVRAFLLVGWLTSLAAWFVSRIVRPYRSSAAALTTALDLEGRHQLLNDAVGSAVEFLKPDPPTGSERFRRVAIRRAENLLQRIDLNRLVPGGAAWKSFGVMLLAVAVAAVPFTTNLKRARTATLRFVDPFGVNPWPTQTRITIDSPSFPHRMAKGDGLDIHIRVHGVIPEVALLTLKLHEATLIEPVPLTPGDSLAASAVITLDATRLQRNFSFRLAANDAETDWQFVEVAPPPRLVPTGERPSPQMTITPPAYSQLPVQDLPDGTGVIECVAGTHVSFAASTDRRIASAELRPVSDLASVDAAATLAPLGALMSPVLAGIIEPAAASFGAAVPLTVSGASGTYLTASFIPRWPGLHALRFTDDTGLTGTRLFDFRVYPDPAPTVVLDRPAAGKDALVLLPTARLRLETRADDRTFGLRRVWAEYRLQRDPAERAIPLADFEALGHTLPAAGSGLLGITIRNAPSASAAGIVSVMHLVGADGRPPVDGDAIILRTAANDWDDVSIGKSPGRSSEVTIRIVSKASLDSLLQKELAALRPDLRRALEQQTDNRKQVNNAAKAAADGTITPDEREAMALAAQNQSQLKANLGDPREGLRTRADALRQIARANNLPNAGMAAQVEATARDLDRIVDENLGPAESALNAARQAADRSPMNPAEAQKAASLLTEAGQQQQQAIRGLTNVLDRLAQWGGAGEVRADAQTLKDKVNRTGEDALRTPNPTRTGNELQGQADDANALMTKAGRIAAEKEQQAKDLDAKAAEKTAQAAAEANPTAAKTLSAEAESLAAAARRNAAEAAALREAIQQGGGPQLAADLRAAAEAARAGQSGNAEANRQSASQRLGQMADALAKDQTAPPPEELKKKLAQDAKALEELRKDQDELKKKTRAAEANPNPDERQKQLANLAREQEQLQKQAELLAEKLSRDRAERTAERVREAAQQMAAALERQQRGQTGSDEQQQALDRLQDAQKQLERDATQAQEQLEREEREKLMEQVKAFRERQAAALAEADRLQAEAVRVKRWDRPLLSSLSDLAEQQKRLGGEVRSFAEKNFEKLPVFGKLMTQAADGMEKAAVKVNNRKDDLLTTDAAFDPETESIAHVIVRKPIRFALQRLDILLEAIKPDERKKSAEGGDPAEPAEPPMGGGGEGGGGPPGESIPSIAQLKALRGLQADVNQRTAEFHKLHPDPAKHGDDEKDELRELEQQQKDIAELFKQMMSALTMPPGGTEIP